MYEVPTALIGLGLAFSTALVAAGTKLAFAARDAERLTRVVEADHDLITRIDTRLTHIETELRAANVTAMRSRSCARPRTHTRTASPRCQPRSPLRRCRPAQTDTRRTKPRLLSRGVGACGVQAACAAP